MQTPYTAITAEQLQEFMPVEGTWESNIPSSDDRDVFEIQSEIEESIRKATGLPVKVELFRTNGHAILDECPDCGKFLATRK